MLVVASLLWCVRWQARVCLTASLAGERPLESPLRQCAICQAGEHLSERPCRFSIGEKSTESPSVLLPAWRPLAQSSHGGVRLQSTSASSSPSVLYCRAPARRSSLSVSYRRSLVQEPPSSLAFQRPLSREPTPFLLPQTPHLVAWPESTIRRCLTEEHLSESPPHWCPGNHRPECFDSQARVCLTASLAGERPLESPLRQCQAGPERPRRCSIGEHPPERPSLLLPVCRTLAQSFHVGVRLQSSSASSSPSVLYCRAPARWSSLSVSYRRSLAQELPSLLAYQIPPSREPTPFLLPQTSLAQTLYFIAWPESTIRRCQTGEHLSESPPHWCPGNHRPECFDSPMAAKNEAIVISSESDLEEVRPPSELKVFTPTKRPPSSSSETRLAI